jgi:non-heme Fe2+,alpha-ketoglutarate-dependent halogenase
MKTLARRLTAKELAFFHENGFVGPFTLCEPEEMAGYRDRIEREVLAKTNEIYGFEEAIGRDRHLDSRAVFDLITNPAIAEILQQILGPDLVVWRSTFFFKPPGAPETVWHSANVFKEFTDHPILEPEDPQGLFQVTTWIAVDEVTPENGPVQLVAGSNKSTTSVGRSDAARQRADQQSQYGADQKGFFGYDLNPEFEIDPAKVHTMICKPGQFFVFDQRTLHGSPPNNSKTRRLAFNFRTIKANTKVYRHFLDAGHIEHYGKTWDLSRWGCIQLAGKNLAGNKLAGAPPVDAGGVAATAVLSR